MSRSAIVCFVGILWIGAAVQSARAQAPKGRTGYVGGTVERSVSLGSGAKPSGGAARTPLAPAGGGLLSNPPRTSSNFGATAPRTPSSRTTTAPRSQPVTSRQPGAVGARGVASLMNDISRTIANSTAATAPRAGGRQARSSPVERVDRVDRDAGPFGGRSERLFGRGRSRDDDTDNDASEASSDDTPSSDDQSQPTGTAVVENESPTDVAPPSPPAPRPTPAPQPTTPPGESLADQLARAYFRDMLRFPGYNPLNNPAWRPDVAKTPPSLRDPSEGDAGEGKPAGESLADQLARDALRDALGTPYAQRDAVNSVLLPKPPPPEKRPESLGDQLARDNLRHLLNYMESHDRLNRQAANRVQDLRPGGLGDGLSREEHKQRLLKIALDYYSRELSALDALDANTVGLSDYVKKLRAERRAEIERMLFDNEILHRQPTKK